MQRLYIVTGGAGFIGSNFVRVLLEQEEAEVLVLDKLTYAGNLASLTEVAEHPQYNFIEGDIADSALVRDLFQKMRPVALFNFAAETHVDRSIDSPVDFIETNVLGTCVLLEEARRYWGSLEREDREKFRFLQVSTDEVYGSLGEDGLFSETTPVNPSSPYSASKASADHFVSAYHHTYGLPTLITNCSNNYGPFQYPEKLIPLMTLNALEGKPLPIYGTGSNVRDWLYVEDHCLGILEVLQRGQVGEKYNLGGKCEKRNVEIVDLLCDVIEGYRPAAENPNLRDRGVASYADLKTFVDDRPGHDLRYAIDTSKVEGELGWYPRFNLRTGLDRTVAWYLENSEWCEAVQSRGYQRERLGLGGKG